MRATLAHALLQIACATAFSLVVAFAAFQVASSIAGPGTSDLGVRVYARGVLAIVGSLASCLTVLTLALVLVLRRVKGANRWLLGTPVALVLFGLSVLLMFAYG